MEPYERLVAWQECHKLVLLVYHVTKTFPDDEKYGLTSQARRAAVSAAMNIVEGHSRRGPKEFRRFLDISRSSLLELGYAMRVARDIGYVAASDWTAFLDTRHRAGYLVWQLYQSLSRAAARRRKGGKD